MFKVENVNPFVDQTISKLKDFGVAQEIEKKEMWLLEKNFETFGRQVGIGITGDLKGTYMFEFKESALACEIASGVAGMEFDEWDEFVLSAIKEFVNIVSGNALITLQSNGKDCNISTPTIREGKFTTTLSDPALRIVYKLKNVYDTGKSAEIAVIVGVVDNICNV